MKIGNVSVELGQTVESVIDIGEMADGTPIQMPIRVARGKESGPTLWVNAAIHGDELEGTAAMWEIFDRLSQVDLTGTLITVLITNVSAFHAFRRTSPYDDLDINRVFPGSPDRSFTDQLAHEYLQMVSTTATHYIDLHGGGNTHDVVYYVIHREVGDASAVETSRQMARVAGSPIVWSSKDHWLDRGSFAQLTNAGIPSMIVEAGGEGRIRAKNVSAHRDSVWNVMKLIGMVADGAAVPRPPSIPVSSADFFFGHRGGIWLSERSVGEVLQRGDLVGVIKDRYGKVREEVRCQVSEGILLALRTYVASPSGSNLGIVGVIRP